jgi:hypothetical protein
MPVDELIGGGSALRPERPETARGTVVTPPVSATAALRVVLQGYSEANAFDVPGDQWTSAAGMPQRGDECLVVFDDDGDCWAIMAGSGAAGGGGQLVSGHWRWTTNVTGVVAGRIAIDTTAWATATVVYVAKVSNDGADTANVLRTIQPGDSLYLQAFADATQWGRYKVTAGAADHGEYVSFAVTFTEGGAGGLPANNADTTLIAMVSAPSAPGGADAYYVHAQGSPSSIWTVTHNLAKHPAVSVVDTGDSVVMPDVHYVSDSQVQLTFGSATSGKAYCS